MLKNEARLESLLRISCYPADNIQDLLDFALQEAIALTDSKIGYIYFYDEKTREFTLNTWSKEVMQLCMVTEKQTVYQLDKTGLWGEAVRQRRAILVNDYAAANPMKKGTPHGHAALHRYLTIPVFSDKEIVAVVGVANKVEEYTPGDIRQLTLMMDTVWKVVERTRAEDALRESEERFHALFEHAPLGYQSLDAQGRFLEVNRAWIETLGYSREEVIGKWFGDLLVPEYRDAFRERFPHFLARGRIHSEFYMLRKDGEPRYIAFDGRIGHNKDGSFKQTHCILRDETQRKRTEMVLQNTQKLEALGVLAGGLAHDFNNLLGGIFGYIDMAHELTENSTIGKYLAKALGSIERARGLTRQLLTFAKGGAPLRVVESLIPFVEETAQFALSGSNVLCNFDIPNDISPCTIDKNQIAQLIDNLVINAQQAMPLGGTMNLSMRNVYIGPDEHPGLQDGAYVCISIRDSGIGIPKELLPRIFDPFFTTKEKGHGLGLATCFSIAARHDGCIDVESQQGSGATFHVYLPAADASRTVSTPMSPARHRGSGTFVVMDDEEGMRETIGGMLNSFGYRAILTENGQMTVERAAEERAAGRRITAMIFDLTIPGGMGGKETVGEVRKICPEVPIFVASGYADDPVMANPSAFGFSGSISKPFMKSELATLLNRHLREDPS